MAGCSWLFVTVGVMCAGGFAAAANPAPKKPRLVRPCASGTPEHQQAAAELAALDADVRKLAPSGDPSPLAKRLLALSRARCFEILTMHRGDLDLSPTTGLALRTWWQDGGYDYVESALGLGGEQALVWIPPSVRLALTLETSPGHRLRPLLCSAADDRCGRETDGWRLRAERVFERDARLARVERDADPRGRPDPTRPRGQDCEAVAKAAPKRRQFEAYRDCVDATADRAPAFPIGRVRAPIEGWLVVSGRRGHYGFCDELRAYDLHTGAFYRVASCSRLALVSGGAVNHRATDAARRLEAEKGSVSLDELREAAWMLLLLDELDTSVLTDGFGRSVPAGVPVSLEDGSRSIHGFSSSFSASSAQTVLTWRVTGTGTDLGVGTVVWNCINEDPPAHAAELLEIAEASFKPGCPTATPPLELAKQVERLSAHRLDTDGASLTGAAATLTEAWKKLVAPGCALGKALHPNP